MGKASNSSRVKVAGVDAVIDTLLASTKPSFAGAPTVTFRVMSKLALSVLVLFGQRLKSCFVDLVLIALIAVPGRQPLAWMVGYSGVARVEEGIAASVGIDDVSIAAKPVAVCRYSEDTADRVRQEKLNCLSGRQLHVSPRRRGR